MLGSQTRLLRNYSDSKNKKIVLQIVDGVLRVKDSIYL